MSVVHTTRRAALRHTALGGSLLTTGCLGTLGGRVDERIDTMPPGTPALTPRGSWPAPRFDAQNTGWNPDGTGLHDGTTAWRLNAGGPASVAGGTLYNTASRDRIPTALTYRDPATARVTTRRDLVEYGVNPPPVVVDGYVFVTTFIEVFCFDAATGEQLWRER